MARTDTLINFLTDVAAAIKAKKGDSKPILAANFDTEIANLPSGGGDNTTLISLIDRSATSFEIPEGTRAIGGYAFACLVPLTNITIPDSVTIIGYDAFYNCSRLTSITIPDGVTSIGSTAFRDCTSLTKINWNAESVRDFSEYDNAFYNAGTAGDGIDVVFGDNVKRIPAYVFGTDENRPKIISVTIGNSVTSIGERAFSFCTGLTEITIPDSVTSIDGYAFEKCTGLTSVTIGNSVTRINDATFRGCTGLTSVTIGNSVTRINLEAFKDCTSLTEIDFSTHTTIPTLPSTSTFSNTSANLVIKVPSALVDEWKAATNWSTYADKIVGV